MSLPDSPDWNQFLLGVEDKCDLSFDRLIPKTTIDHLLTEEERQKAAQERKEFEAVGREMFLTKEYIYPCFYNSARCRLDAGESPDEIRALMSDLEQASDDPMISIILEAYEDVLAGNPPRFSYPFWTKPEA
jgi:hypothetical protein